MTNSNGKQISFLALVIISIVAAATSGCNAPLTSDNDGCFDPNTGRPTGHCADGGINPDSSVTPDSSTPSETFTVTGTIDNSWGAISGVDMVSADLGTVLTANCTVTPIENGHVRFSCAGPVQANNEFLVRFRSGSSTFAVVTNFPGSSPTTTCALAHGVWIGDITEGSDKFGYEIYSTNPGVADPSNPCRLSY